MVPHIFLGPMFATGYKKIQVAPFVKNLWGKFQTILWVEKISPITNCNFPCGSTVLWATLGRHLLIGVVGPGNTFSRSLLGSLFTIFFLPNSPGLFHHLSLGRRSPPFLVMGKPRKKRTSYLVPFLGVFSDGGGGWTMYPCRPHLRPASVRICFETTHLLELEKLRTFFLPPSSSRGCVM